MSPVTLSIDAALEKAIELLREIAHAEEDHSVPSSGVILGEARDYQQALDSYREQQMKDQRNREAVRQYRGPLRRA